MSNNGAGGIDIHYGTVKDSMSSLNGGDDIFAFHALLIGNFMQWNGGCGLNGHDISTAQNVFEGNSRGEINPQLVIAVLPFRLTISTWFWCIQERLTS